MTFSLKALIAGIVVILWWLAAVFAKAYGLNFAYPAIIAGFLAWEIMLYRFFVDREHHPSWFAIGWYAILLAFISWMFYPR